MKKILLPGVLLLSISATSQNSRQKPSPSGITDMSEKLRMKYEVVSEGAAKMRPQKADQNPGSALKESATATTLCNAAASPTIQWKAIASSMNINGVLVSQSHPLNYYDDLNAVSFIHRTGAMTGTTYPVNNSGSIVMEVSSNWGANWNGTCIWSDANNLARYPQGGLYNPPGNTNLSNAYAVGMGPVTNGTNWKGDWYASKPLSSYNNTASATPGAQQFIANTSPFAPGLAKHDFSRYSFAATDDGAVRSLAIRCFSLTNGDPSDTHGAAIVKGTFNAGVFNWTSDTLIPNVVVKTDGTRQLWSVPIMAWDETGATGYVVFIGSSTSVTASNQGWQPIVYKTTNSGSSWQQINGIDFNSPAMQPIKDHIASVNTNSNLEIPFFNVSEGYDAVVDKAGRLHIVSTIVGTARQHPDSLAYTYQFGTEKYSWGYAPGDMPYVYDFIGDGTGPWSYVLVDSLSSEGPGLRSIDPGYADNPWDPDPANNNNKVVSDCRIQAARSVDGSYVLYSWAESDTNFTAGAKKWNSIPNVKARCLDCSAPSPSTTPVLFCNKINVTRPNPAVPVTYSTNVNISSRAMFHYQSPVVACVNGAGTPLVTFKVPFTVSNSNPYGQTGENNHWYTTATLQFAQLNVGLNEQASTGKVSFGLYPNPAKNNTSLMFSLREDAAVNVKICNMIGQEVRNYKSSGTSGDNNISLELGNLPSGVYLVSVRAGNAESVKKLIIE
jgi:hypothetical protein